MQGQNSEYEQQFLSVVSQFAIDMLSLNTEHDVVWHLAKEVVANLKLVDAVIYLYDENRDVLVQAAAFGDKNPKDEEILAPIEIAIGQGVVGKAAATRKPLRIDDCREFSDYIVDDAVRLSELAVPMLAGEEFVGVIDSEHPERAYFTDKHEQALTAVASIAATKILKTRTIDTLKSTVQELEHNVKLQDTLFEIAELVYNSDSLLAFYQSLQRCINRITYAKNFLIAIEDTDTGVLNCPYYLDEYDVFDDDSSINISEHPSITGYILRTQQALLVNKADIHQMMDEGKFYVEGTMPEALLGVPFGDETMRGVVLVQSYNASDVYKPTDTLLLGFVAKHIHIALKRLQAKAELEFMALHDPLTQLPNRLLFSDRVEHAIKSFERSQTGIIAVMFLDLDKFKAINDNHGHHIGDQMLVHVSAAIDKVMRKSDTFARLGGDEFAILLERINDKEEIRKIGRKIIDAVGQTITIDGRELSTTTSIGVSTYQGLDMTSEQLLIEADEAMYLAKLQGRNRIFFFDEKGGERQTRSHKFDVEFSQALTQQDFKLVFQPIINLHDDQIIAAESLVRWHHPNLGTIYPDAFIDELETNGRIIDLDIYVLRAAIDYLTKFQTLSDSSFRLSINVSGLGFCSQAFYNAVENIADTSPDILPHMIFEITEQGLIENFDDATANMKKFRKLGVKIALDDFGTGYSSLSYLHRLHFDYIKIDRSFMTAKEDDSSSAIIFESIISLANALQIHTTAEGIEEPEQLARVRELGCHFAQGYFIGTPVSADDFIYLLKQGSKSA
ncbi:EAL domain-containing protein [Aestuariibacter salexigens]|uniref:EAL domain-containing protein n=1 Tax=Aestuariibacter salexigens TaxID=226010 RepID=UPI00146FA078|nr:EAL domain-containing protein [Aestuariibacter salexigens]